VSKVDLTPEQTLIYEQCWIRAGWPSASPKKDGLANVHGRTTSKARQAVKDGNVDESVAILEEARKKSYLNARRSASPIRE
jgi:hypothetical protein